MTIPEGMIEPGQENMVARLKKSLYSLVQAPRANNKNSTISSSCRTGLRRQRWKFLSLHPQETVLTRSCRFWCTSTTASSQVPVADVSRFQALFASREFEMEDQCEILTIVRDRAQRKGGSTKKPTWKRFWTSSGWRDARTRRGQNSGGQLGKPSSRACPLLENIPRPKLHLVASVLGAYNVAAWDSNRQFRQAAIFGASRS
jgi:hypothetical protein